MLPVSVPILVDCVLAAGIVTCLVFILLLFKRKPDVVVQAPKSTSQVTVKKFKDDPDELRGYLNTLLRLFKELKNNEDPGQDIMLMRKIRSEQLRVRQKFDLVISTASDAQAAIKELN